MAKLAINGGKQVLPKGMLGIDNVDLGTLPKWPIITEKEKNAVMGVLDSGTLMGAFAPQVKALQKEWAEYVGTKYCLATGSGTSAIHIAVKGAGIKAGDEVITSALTFVASAFGVLNTNAIPVFVDIDPLTYNIDPLKIEAKITDKTRAILPVHLHGMPADMDEIKAIAKKYNLVVIEDACQAHGATYKGKKAGALGDISAFSLNGSKNLPGAEGGLFNTDNDKFYFEAKKVRDLGEIIEEGVERDYNAYEVGWMYRYNEILAAFTRIRLQSLDIENEIRIKNANYLSEKLSKLKGIITPYVPDDRTSVFHLYRIRLVPSKIGLDVPPKEFRAKVQKALRAEGVQANRWQNRPVPMQNIFQDRIGYGYGCPWTCPYGKGFNVTYKEEDFIETRKVVDDSFVIHSAIYPPNGFELLDKYVEAFTKLWDNLDEVLEVKINPREIYLKD
ncbi:MAG: DegT/DnrJ/EryC1/StrS family aminotransferase [Actinobacteria bacterium]|nr:DegT/DnrJ/EryC1/StrS family aminotransferase [Actinomycetota bacterium]